MFYRQIKPTQIELHVVEYNMGNGPCMTVQEKAHTLDHVKYDRLQPRFSSDTKRTVKHTPIVIRDSEAKSILDTIISQLNELNNAYLDPDFRVQPLTLKSEDTTKACRWARISEVVGETHCLSGEEGDVMVADEIMQYFGVFLMFLAQNSELVPLIVATQPNSFGLYMLTIFVEGAKQQLIIDDYILCDGTNKPVFSQPIHQQVWPLVLEKAWMKVVGSVAQLEHHQPQQPYHLFTNSPSSTLLLSDLDDSSLRQLLSNRDKFTFLESRQQNTIKIGLSGKKHFSVLGTFTINQQFFVVLRNPCGKFDFRGSWAEPTPTQINHVHALGHSMKTPGIFIVDQQELDQFESLALFHYIKDYMTSSFEVLLSSKEMFLMFRVRSQQRILVSIHQKGAKPSPLMVDLFSLSAYQPIPTTSIWGLTTLNLTEEMILVPSDQYILRIKPTSPIDQPLNVRVYADHLLQFQSNQEEYKYHFEQMLQKIGQKNLMTHSTVRPNFEYKITWMSNRALLCVKNISKQQKAVKLDLHFPNLRNLECREGALKGLSSGQIVPLEVKEYFLVVLEKVELHAETSIGEFSITSY